MPVPISRTPGAMFRTLAPNVLPTVKNLLTRLPTTQSSNRNTGHTSSPSNSTATFRSTSTPIASGSHFFRPKVLTLFGAPHTDRIVGATTLHHVIRRHICSINKKTAEDSSLTKPMAEPYGAAIRSVEPDFLKLGYMKTHEEEFLTIFSDGLYKVAIRRDPKHPQNEYFIDRNHCAHSLRRLRYQFNSEAENQKEAEARQSLIEKYGLSKDDTPIRIKAKGLLACAAFDLKQSIQFLETRQEELCQLIHPSEAMLAGGVTFTLGSPEKSTL